MNQEKMVDGDGTPLDLASLNEVAYQFDFDGLAADNTNKYYQLCYLYNGGTDGSQIVVQTDLSVFVTDLAIGGTSILKSSTVFSSLFASSAAGGFDAATDALQLVRDDTECPSDQDSEADHIVTAVSNIDGIATRCVDALFPPIPHPPRPCTLAPHNKLTQHGRC